MKNLSTRFTVVSRAKGGSAIYKASYISREELFSEYDGTMHRPDKTTEDLVHAEVSLPDNAPSIYLDRETLWNSVELVEKQKNAQLYRMMKASLPNSWTYEVAEEVIRKYIMENFVSKGMCADWAIHDSVNEKGQRILHFHLLLTLRSIYEEGKWMPKQKKIYILDKDGNKIRTKKGYKSKTEKTNDWDDKSYGRIWRKNLTDLINQTNEALKIEEQWEYRSFKEMRIEEPPTIHLGSRANALEKKGIATERGDYNRKVLEIRGLVSFIEQTSASIEAFKKKAADVTNEVVDIIKAVVKRHGRLQLPVYGGVFLRKIKNREKLQDADHMMRFASAKDITDFEKLDAFKDSHEAHYNALLDEFYEGVDRQNLLYEMIDAWDRFKPYSDIKKQSLSLKGLAKLKYDMEHKEQLADYPDHIEAMRRIIPEGEPITPKKWQAEIKSIVKRRDEINAELKVEVSDLACAETLKYNKSHEEQERLADERVAERKQNRTHNRKRSDPER